MPNHFSQSTITYNQEVLSRRDSEVLLVRWAFPFPVIPPTRIEAVRLTLGRDEDCNVVLPSTLVSRHHAAIQYSGPWCIVSDLQSKNGVFLNAKRIKDAVLSPGDVLRIGDYVGVCMQAPRNVDLSFDALGADIYGGYLHRAAVGQLRELAGVDIPVLIEGETGTGKERFARALHDWSGRKGPFLAVNCSTYSKSVAAAELFGYRKGAFTGAEQGSVGHLRAAEGGTLLLDELIELPFDMQAMLLRAIENREVIALGETRPVSIDVRFVAATQLAPSGGAGVAGLRPDLRARLEAGKISLPPLRACREIVPELFAALFQRHAAAPPELTTAIAEHLCLHEWPLNVRELENLAKRLTIQLRSGRAFDLKALETALGPLHRPTTETNPPAGAEGRHTPIPGRPSGETYESADIDVLLKALSLHQGNVSKAAAEVGITRQKAYRMLQSTRKSK